MITDKWMQRRPRNADQWAGDEAPRGAGRLVARITPGGERLFYYRYTNGRQIRLPLGAYDKHGRDGLTLAQARLKAGDLSKLYQSGVLDIRGHEEARRHALEAQRQAAEEARRTAEQAAKAGSLRALLDAYVRYLVRGGKPSAGDVRRLLKLHVLDAHPDLSDRRAADLRARDLRPVLAALIDAEKGRTAAKIRAYIRAAATLALRAETDPSVPGDFLHFALELNPAEALPALSQFNRTRDRALTELELHEYLLSLPKVPNAIVGAALESSLYLGGQRAAQLLRVVPGDVDLHGRVIRLRDSKGRRHEPRLHELPLTDRPAALIGKILEITVDASCVFTNDGRRACTVDTLSKAVSEISASLVEQKKITAPFGFGDLRRTCETHMARLGIDKEARAHIQSHGLGGVQTRNYNRHDYMPEKRMALTQWARYLDKLKAGRRQSKVIALRANDAPYVKGAL